ncbi:MAG: phosphonate degradation HD-domain oxygenase [Brachymonas sp.]
MALTLDDIVRLLDQRGAQQYGLEAVNQREHALQCAYLAETAGESTDLIIACLLHDLGHLLAAEKAGTADTDTSRDDLHQYSLLPFLRGVLPDAVLEPIRHHVDAKRYLCQVEAGYFATLSIASVHSLSQQGGVYTAEQARAFLQQPFAEDAVRLRRYDDQAKEPARVVPPLDHYLPRLEQLMLQIA